MNKLRKKLKTIKSQEGSNDFKILKLSMTYGGAAAAAANDHCTNTRCVNTGNSSCTNKTCDHTNTNVSCKNEYY